MKYTIEIRKSETIEVSRTELGHMVYKMAFEIFNIDDPGCDYFTTADGDVYMGDSCFGNYPILATMIDTANILLYGEIMDYWKSRSMPEVTGRRTS